jgi:hypothetical protein
VYDENKPTTQRGRLTLGRFGYHHGVVGVLGWLYCAPKNDVFEK